MELTDKIRRVYLPMTETGFYILFCLQKENHGYGITEEEKRKIYQITDLGRKVLGIELKRIERLYRNSLGEG